MNLLKNKKILITGGTGSVGKEIIERLIDLNPKVVRILDINENALFEMQQELSERKNIRFLLGDIRDKERLSRAVEDVDVIFHCASLKHVTACEYNPFEAVKTNVIGTQNLIDAAISEEVEKVIFTSSDKAVNPSSTMGASKLLSEKLIISANYHKGPRKTTFSCVRFGNILGSNGSVVPLFKHQIKNGGPITITDSEMTRFVIPIRDAINLLFRATEMAQGGEIFVMKMPVVKIIDLAEVLIEELASKYGKTPKEIEIKIIGAKPGEKLYEELMTEDEAKRTLEVENMLIITPELRELTHFDESKYQNAKSTKLQSYMSKDAKPFAKEKIKDLLIKENLL